MRLAISFYIIVTALFIIYAPDALAEPTAEYSSIFDPVDSMLAPCMEKGEACLAEGLAREECEGVVEACLDELDNRAREDRYAKSSAAAESKAIAACEDIVKGCFEETRNMDSCIVGVLRCREDGAGEPYPCCPRGCVQDYKGLVNSGISDIDAFLTVFVSNKTECFTDEPH